MQQYLIILSLFSNFLKFAQFSFQFLKMSLFKEKCPPRNSRTNGYGRKVIAGPAKWLTKKWGLKIDNLFFCKFLAERKCMRSKWIVWVLPKNEIFAKRYSYIVILHDDSVTTKKTRQVYNLFQDLWNKSLFFFPKGWVF